jgi:hypothetical protein
MRIAVAWGSRAPELDAILAAGIRKKGRLPKEPTLKV